MGTLLQDLRYGLRMLAKSPAFTAVAVLTLALGIGANTAIFSVVNAVLLRPLPFPQSDQLMSVQYFDTVLGVPHKSASYPDFFDWRNQNQVFSHITAFHDNDYTLTGRDQPAHLSGEIVSADFFSTLDVAPALGRGFLPEEEKAGHRVVVLSDRLWRTTFSADPKILGQGIILGGRSYTVVGVMPPGFNFPIQTPTVQLWTTLADDATATAPDPPITSERGAHFLLVVGRVKAGVSVGQAQADMVRINSNLSKQYPDTNLHFSSGHVEPLLDQLVGNVEPALLVLFGAVGCVLLIACANVANLLLARSMTRQKEMAIRSALGAGRGRVIRQLLTESIVLAIFGGFLGLAFAVWGTQGLIQLVPEDIPRMSQIKIDSHVFGFTLLAAIVTGILFGLFPALHGSKTNLVDSLKESGRGLSGSLQHNRLRGSLVVVEMALALALLMGAGLMIQSFARLQSVNPGFNPHNVLTFNFDLPDSRYNTAQQKTFYLQLLSRLNALPGVSSAAASWTLPFSGDNASISFSIEGRPVAKGNEPNSAIRIISPAYFQTLRIPIIEGRDFAPTDTATAPGVVIINQQFAHLFFPNENPIGKHITPGVSDGGKEMVRQIIGVVANVKARTLRETPRPEYYLPYQQCLITGLSIVVRTQTAPQGLVGAARDTVHSMDSNLPLYGVQTMDDFVGASVSQPRFSMLLLSIFAGLALALTALGLYGVISYSVAQRTHEIGIRMALGAQAVDVLKLVIRQAMLLAVIGWAAGIVCGFILGRFLSSQLYGITTTDPVTLLAVTLVLGGIAFLASYIPARRATHVDPLRALRYE